MIEHRHSVESSPLFKRLVAYGGLSTACFNLIGCAQDDTAEWDSHLLPGDSRYSIVASADYNVEDGEFKLGKNALPQQLGHDIYVALNDPIVDLAIQTGDVKSASAHMIAPNATYNYSDPHPSPENATFGDGHIRFIVDTAYLSVNEKVFRNAFTVHTVAVHEAIHGLNDEWWKAMHSRVPTSDHEKLAKMFELNQVCDDVTDWFRTIQPTQQSNTVSDSSFAASCKPMKNYRIPLALAEDKFRCVDEGFMHMDTEQLRFPAAAGHPYSNATELASSATTILAFHPDYIERCMENQDQAEAILIKRYIKATLELSFLYRPELETLLREKPETSDALNYLLSAI